MTPAAAKIRLTRASSAALPPRAIASSTCFCRSQAYAISAIRDYPEGGSEQLERPCGAVRQLWNQLAGGETDGKAG